MEFDKTLLKTMLREYWSLNNTCCELVTIVCLRRLGISDKDIVDEFGLIDPQGIDLTIAENTLKNAVQETQH
jgi:hypothetical protein